MQQLLSSTVNQRALATLLTPFYFLFQSKKLLLRFAMLVMSVGMMSGVVGQATVKTDKLDYPPGATAIITGTGFQPGEYVELHVHHAEGDPMGTDPQHHQPWFVTADSVGNFTSSWYVPTEEEGDALGATLLLEAHGNMGSEAMWTFTDGPNDKYTPSISPAVICANTSQTYTFKFINDNNASSRIRSVIIDIPVAAGSITVISAKAYSSSNTLLGVWTNESTTTQLKFKSPATSTDLDAALDYLEISFTTTLSSTSTWVTTAYRVNTYDPSNNNLANRIGSDPVVTVNASLPVSVSISSNDADNTICAGSSVTFTATPTNGGANPSYQWKLNGNDVGLNQATYTTTNLTSGDQINVILTSNATCTTGNPATSNTITTTVNTAPTFTTCPSNITTATAEGVCTKVVSYTVTATGIPVPTMTYVFSGATTGNGNGTGSGSTFNKGTTHVKVTATNLCGVVDCEFDITVNDTESPSGTQPSPITNINTCLPSQSDANDAFNATLAASGYSDNCGGTVTAVMTNATVSGTKCNWTITYTFSVKDQYNNVLANQTYTRSGGDKTAPTGTAPAAITNVDACLPTQAEANAAFNATLAASGYSDACGGVVTAELVSAVVSGTKCSWSILYTFKVKDECGNYLYDQTYTRSGGDKTAPTWFTASGSLNTTVTCGQISLLESAQALEPTATDNCGGTITYVKTSGLFVPDGANGAGTYTNTWIAKDQCNNQTMSVFTQTITVVGITIDASASSAPVPYVAGGASATLSATVTPAVAGVSVKFYLDGVEKGTAFTTVQNVNGSPVATATLLVTGLPVELYQVKAVAGNACSESIAYLAVYDPSGGFVTGGGWILSPVIPELQYMQVGGKANFGFNAKYKKGSTTVVEGNTEFQFQAGNLNFKSTSHESMSLVIAGAKAVYKGVGTINGLTGYSFMVSGIDGDLKTIREADRFRIKIWITATGQTVYDNQDGDADNAEATTALGGGSIVIHEVKKKTANRMEPGVFTLAPQDFNVKVLGNPSITSFRLQLQGSNMQEKFTVKVVDINGRLIEVQQNLYAGQVIELGSKYTQGTYFAEVTQGTNRKVVKLIKVSRD